MADTISPASFSEVAAALAHADSCGRPVRFLGAGTRQGWGGPPPRHALRVSSSGLARTLSHDPREWTATFEAGIKLAEAQRMLAEHGQMIALDPQPRSWGPRGPASRDGTLGGAFVTADSGPLRHRYGTLRDQVLGLTVALADGTVARAGAGVIRNAAGYDLVKLFSGSFGTLGMVLALSVRLHPLPGTRATALGATENPLQLRDVALELGAGALDLDAFDFAWHAGRGGLLARSSGEDAGSRGAEVASAMRAAGLANVELVADDEALWERQRSGQRSIDRAVVIVSFPVPLLDEVARLTDRMEAIAVGRAAAGVAYLTLPVNRVARLRAALPGAAHAIVTDLPVAARGAVEPWGPVGAPELALMRALKREFDPTGTCNPGSFVGGI